MSVVLNASCRNLLSRNIDDHIRCAIQPFCRLDIQRCQRIDPCSIDGTAVNPEHKLLNFPSSNLVDTMEIVNVCVIYLAWRHTFGDQSFPNHWGPALDHLVIIHSKWSNATFPVAGYTPILKNWSDIV